MRNLYKSVSTFQIYIYIIIIIIQLYHTCSIRVQECKSWFRQPKLTSSVISNFKPVIYFCSQKRKQARASINSRCPSLGAHHIRFCSFFNEFAWSSSGRNIVLQDYCHVINIHCVPFVVNMSAVMDLHCSRPCATLIQSLYDIFVHSLMLFIYIVLGLPRPPLPFILPSSILKKIFVGQRPSFHPVNTIIKLINESNFNSANIPGSTAKIDIAA